MVEFQREIQHGCSGQLFSILSIHVKGDLWQTRGSGVAQLRLLSDQRVIYSACAKDCSALWKSVLLSLCIL